MIIATNYTDTLHSMDIDKKHKIEKHSRIEKNCTMNLKDYC